MIRAVTYCRCSTEEESQQDALKHQVVESRQSVSSMGWLLADEYIEAKSGTTTAGRNEYNRLYAELQTDKFDIVVIKSQDRLMRNTKDWYLFIDRLLANGKKLYMYLEKKFYSADDALITGIKAILAEEYSKELSRKINHAHQHRQKEGRSFILPPGTFGLKKKETGEIMIVQEEAQAIRTMFFLCKRMGCLSIEHYLEEKNIRDRYGKPFKAEAIRRIIRNPIRYGTVIQNKRHFDFQLKRVVRVPENEWVIHENAVPAVVSREEWLEANAAMDERAEKQNPKGCHPRGRNPGKYQLSGKILCGECGGFYYRRYRKRYKNKKMIAEWKCQRYIQKGRSRKELRNENVRKIKLSSGQGCDNIHLDEEKLTQLLEKISEQYYGKISFDDNELVEKIMRILREVLEEHDINGRVESLKKEKNRCGNQKKRLLEKLLDEVITDKEYKEKREELEKKEALMEEQLGRLNGAENARIVLEKRLKAIRRKLEEGGFKQAVQAEMIDSIETVTVFPDRLLIQYKPDKMMVADGSVLERIENAADAMGRQLQIEARFDVDFLYQTKKEAQLQRIMEYMHENPEITAKTIAEKEQVSLSAIHSRIRKLRKQGRIHFNGAGGHGKWVVSEEDKQ